MYLIHLKIQLGLFLTLLYIYVLCSTLFLGNKNSFPKKSAEQRTCNCLNKNNFPLEQKCLTTNTVYKAKVTSSNRNYQAKVYFDSCETTFKKRFSNHKKSFNLYEYKNETKLSNEKFGPSPKS